MKQLLVVGLMLLSGCTVGYADIGIGAAVPDNENVESSVIGVADIKFNINDYISIGLSAGQTGNFKQDAVPQEVQYANKSPQAFTAKQFPHHGDVIIIEGDDITNIVTINDAPNKLPSRPQDMTEQKYWFANPFLEIGIPVGPIRPYARAFLGAAGIKSYNGDSRIGLTKGVGGGVAFNISKFTLAVESMRRHTETNVATYGSWEHMAKIGLRY